MKKILIILISLFVLLTAVACIGRRAAPAESGTTEESLEGSWWITEEKVYPPIDKATFDMIEIGRPASEYSDILSGYKSESYGYRATKYYCTDGSVMYVTYRELYDAESGDFISKIIYAVSPELVEIKYDRNLIDEITVGMSYSDVIEIMGDPGIDTASGVIIGIYKFVDGGHAVINYEHDIEDDTWYVKQINVLNEDADVF